MNIKKPVALLMGLNMLSTTPMGLAAPIIPGFTRKVSIPLPATTTTLPQGGSIVSGSGTITATPGANELVINQNSSQMIVNWEKFNIGAAAAVRFNQRDQTGTPQKNWAALNRIYDKDPSLIFGKLSGDGKVYLINQNGIMFGAGSQVNVHSLVASSLNLRDADFLKGTLKFTAENYQNSASGLNQGAVVVNQGSITTTNGGTVFLLGPTVENSGSITASAGKVDLIASAQTGQNPDGTVADVQIKEVAENGSNDVVYRTKPTAGVAQNLEGGRILADQGRVGMFGHQVRQEGLIRAVTAVKQAGAVYLFASDRVTTGAGSVTDVSISDSKEKLDRSFTFQGGTVSIGGVSTTTNGSDAHLQTLEVIEHNGAIVAPSGTVDLRATRRVFLGDTSSINVAGLWVDRAASDSQLEVQLTSDELKDSYGQKNGFLKGEKIKVDILTGTTIADISKSYLLQPQSARERATTGGTVFIGAPELDIPDTRNMYVLNDIIVKPGALLDFSGGGYRYAAGTIQTSRLLAGNTLYDISTAPQWLTYTKVVNGTRHVGERTVGSDAGKLTLQGRQVLLDGTLKAEVKRGRFQTAVTSHSDQDHRAYDVSVARGLEETRGGTLQIGLQGATGFDGFKKDLITREIVVAAAPVAASASIGVNDAIGGDGRTVLSAEKLSALKLSRLGLYANTKLTIAAGARLRLQPGGTLDGMARVVHMGGGISLPSGTVSFSLIDNISSHPVLQNAQGTDTFVNDQYTRLNESFVMDRGASISVAGERIDNSQLVPGGTPQTGHTSGGTIQIKDITVAGTKDILTGDGDGHSLIIRDGAELDVSGGYTIDSKSKVSGADAGTLELRAATLSLAGDLRGHSLAGSKGGQLTLHAGEVLVTSASLNIPEQVDADAPLPDTLRGKLVLGEHRLDQSGFGRVELSAINDVTVAEGITLRPSTAKLAAPQPGKGPDASLRLDPDSQGSDVSADIAGATKLTLNAGQNIYKDYDFTGTILSSNESATLAVAAGARLTSTPGGGIVLAAPSIRMEGTLQALSGAVDLTASQRDLTLASGASITAAGYNKPTTSTIVGVPSGASPQAGGSVSLTSSKGQVILEQGSLVDVSGSEPTTVMVKNAAGIPEATVIASAAGSLDISSSTGLLLDGRISGRSAIQGQAGGSLSVKQTAGDGLAVSAEDIRRYMVSGFDALKFAGSAALLFQSGMDMHIGRSLTLDAPLIKGNGSDSVTLSAPWVRLINSSDNIPASPAVESGQAHLTLKGDWLDIQGSTSLAGFGTASLLAGKDLRLSDSYYAGTIPGWHGSLQTGGKLVLQGARIYPTTASEFKVISGGSVSILPSATSDNSPIYSAGGNLTITANGINHSGYLAAPMGQLSLNAGSGRLYLADGSVTRTSGNAMVNYGSFDGTYWTVKDTDTAKGPRVEEAPKNTLTLSGGEVIVRQSATLDSSGGGSVSTYLFQPGLEGSLNPISIDGRSSVNSTTRTGPNRFVILQDNSVQLPGFTYTDANNKTRLAGAVHLQATRLDDGTLLKEGTYSLLPESFAFLPGALVLSNLGMPVAPGVALRTSEGYRVVSGYDTYAGTSVTSPLTGYSIRRASEVLKEGNFTKPAPLVAGSSGDVTITGTSTILSAPLTRNTLQGFKPGQLILAGKNITLQEETVNLPAQFTFETLLPADLVGTMRVSGSALSGGPLTIGKESVTDSITIKGGSEVNAPEVTLVARKNITLEAGASIEAGTATLSAHDGVVTIEGAKDQIPAASLHASQKISLDADALQLDGVLKSDHDISFTSKAIVIAPVTDSTPGLHLGSNVTDGFKDLDNVTLTSTGDGKQGGTLTFLQDTALTTKKSLTIDAARIAGGTDQHDITMTARSIALHNSGTAAGQDAAAGSSTLTLKADAITLADSIVADRFGEMAFKPATVADQADLPVNDLTLKGAGSLKTAGNLNMEAARITTSYTRDKDGTYHAADYSVTAGGAITITGNGKGKAGNTATPGGILSLTGSSISDSGNIVMPSGQVNLTATTGDLTLDGATIDTKGMAQLAADKQSHVYTPGGQITLRSSKGELSLKNKSELDVSATEQGNAGAITLLAPARVDLSGVELKGNAPDGRGASFTIDTDRLDTVNGVNGLTAVVDKLKAGGFNNRLNIRTRQGDLELAAGKTLSGREVILTADGKDDPASKGNITVNGTISASSTAAQGGRVELYANRDLTVNGTIEAKGAGTGAEGGEVWLNSANDRVVLAKDSKIDLTAPGKGGSLYLRAQRNGDGVNMDLQGTVTGAAQVVAEAVRVYDNDSGTVTETDQEKYKVDNDTYMSETNAGANRTALLAGLKGVAAGDFNLRPGIEIRRSGDLALAANWDLTGWRYDNGAGLKTEPGVLTLRSIGNLSFGGVNTGFNLTDHPTPLADLNSKPGGTLQNSWAYNLVAGADKDSANPLATVTGTGNLSLLVTDKEGNLTAGALIYTENAPLRFASGNATDIGTGVAGGHMINDSIRYNFGTYGGDIRGETGGHLTIRAGAIQSAVGNIDLRVGSDLNLLSKKDSGGSQESIGTIRTTGEYTPGADVEVSPGGTLKKTELADYWTYNNGGDIDLTVAGKVAGAVNRKTGNNGADNAWDMPVGKKLLDKFLAANYDGTNASEGIITMGGGNIDVRTGGSFTSQTGLFGAGDLHITSGGDLSGRFRLSKGDGRISAMGNFGFAGTDGRQVLELKDARMSVAAQGDMFIGAVLNPDNTRDDVLLKDEWNLTFGYANPNLPGSRDAAAHFSSLSGSVTFDGNSSFAGYLPDRQQILPPDFSIQAAGDIFLENSFALAPSPTGNLKLAAGGTINGDYVNSKKEPKIAKLAMVDISPASVYGRVDNNPKERLFTSGSQSDTLLHAGDTVPVVISADRGDITNLQLDLNKKAVITAGNDIRELLFTGQNLAADDITAVRAGHDIFYKYDINRAGDYVLGEGAAPGIRLGGPGTLLVQAGNNIDLGNSAGIQSFGNRLNSALDVKGSNLVVLAGALDEVAGYGISRVVSDAAGFFHGTGSENQDFVRLLERIQKADKAGLAEIARQLVQAAPDFIEQVKKGEIGLQLSGNSFTNMKNLAGRSDLDLDADTKAKLKDYAQQIIDQTRSGKIRTYFAEKSKADGSINMVNSQISTLTGPDEIFIMARSNLNVGKTTFATNSKETSKTGITTSGGGPINIYAGGDINVNESRVMSLLGGDITVWSDGGNINAGRGSRTTVAAPKKIPDEKAAGGYRLEAPSIGSGIRAVTFDPNATPAGEQPVPEPGNIYMFAPNGNIDAGEAGIAGGRVMLGANQVLNAKNISFGNGSVGVPTSSEGGISLGALAGAGSLAENSKTMEQASAIGGAKDKSVASQGATVDEFMSKFLDVKVISFDTNEGTIDKKDNDKEE